MSPGVGGERRGGGGSFNAPRPRNNKNDRIRNLFKGCFTERRLQNNKKRPNSKHFQRRSTVRSRVPGNFSGVPGYIPKLFFLRRTRAPNLALLVILGHQIWVPGIFSGVPGYQNRLFWPYSGTKPGCFGHTRVSNLSSGCILWGTRVPKLGVFWSNSGTHLGYPQRALHTCPTKHVDSVSLPRQITIYLSTHRSSRSSAVDPG